MLVMYIIIGALGFIILILGSDIIITKKDTKGIIERRDEIINEWSTRCREAEQKNIGLEKEIKNLNIENVAINEQRNMEQKVCRLKENQIEKIREIIEEKNDIEDIDKNFPEL